MERYQIHIFQFNLSKDQSKNRNVIILCSNIGWKIRYLNQLHTIFAVEYIIMCGGQNDADDNGCGDGENVKLQDNLPIGMTIMDFDTLTPSRW